MPDFTFDRRLIKGVLRDPTGQRAWGTQILHLGSCRYPHARGPRAGSGSGQGPARPSLTLPRGAGRSRRGHDGARLQAGAGGETPPSPCKRLLRGGGEPDERAVSRAARHRRRCRARPEALRGPRSLRRFPPFLHPAPSPQPRACGGTAPAHRGVCPGPAAARCPAPGTWRAPRPAATAPGGCLPRRAARRECLRALGAPRTFPHPPQRLQGETTVPRAARGGDPPPDAGRGERGPTAARLSQSGAARGSPGARARRRACARAIKWVRGGRRKAPVTAAAERQSRANRERAREPARRGPEPRERRRAGDGAGPVRVWRVKGASAAQGAAGGGGQGRSGAGGREQEAPRAAVRPSAERSAVGRPAAGAVSTTAWAQGWGRRRGRRRR